MADEGNGKILLFGGRVNGIAQNDTWEWNGSNNGWTKLTPQNKPPARYLHSLASEGTNHKVLLFGGTDGNGNVFTDTWEWDGTNWTQLNPSHNPSQGLAAPREAQSMALETDGKVILFGGFITTQSGGVFTRSYPNDTWRWTGTDWQSVSTAHSPPGRSTFMMSNEATSGKVLIFGGINNDPNNSNNNGRANDTWEWAGTDWTNLTPSSNNPSARANAVMALDKNNHVVLFGGQSPTLQALGDTWIWNGSAWSQSSPASSPSGRFGCGMAYDSKNKQTVLNSGTTNNTAPVVETWLWDGASWTQTGLNVLPNPAVRSTHAMADEGGGKILLFGGSNGTANYYTETWEWDGKAHTWTHLSPGSTPSGRKFFAMASEGGGKILLFGGTDANNQALSDTWEWGGTNWTPLSPAHHPPARNTLAMAPEGNGKVLLFGGADSNGALLGDTWEWNGSDWAQKFPAHNPTARYLHAMASEGGGKVLIFGGQGPLNNSVDLGDTWEWNSSLSSGNGDWTLVEDGSSWQYDAPNTRWTQKKTPPTSPVPRTGHSMTFDSTRQRVVLFAGRALNGASNPLTNETWEWDGTKWIDMNVAPANIALNASPSARQYSAMAFDAALGFDVLGNPCSSSTGIGCGGATVIFAGEDAGTRNDTWDYFGTPPTFTSLTRITDPLLDPPGNVHFSAAFSEAVFILNGNDFSFDKQCVTNSLGNQTCNVTSPFVSNVPTGPLQNNTITVNTGTVAVDPHSGANGEGTLGLKLTDNDTIRDVFGYPIGGLGTGTLYTDTTDNPANYTIDNLPVVSSVNRVGSTPSNAASVQFTVTFNKNVTGVDATDFQLTTTGTISGASVTSVSPSGATLSQTFTVTVNTGTGDGTIRLDVKDDDTIVDPAGSKLGGTGTGNGAFTSGQSYTIDKTPPFVSSINRANSDPTNAGSVQYNVTFSEAVTGVDATDFQLATTGAISGASISNTVTTSDNIHYTVTVNTGTGDGTIGLNLVDNNSIADLATNILGCSGNLGACDGSFTGQVYTVDKTPPVVSSINRVETTPTNAASVNFTVTFSEVVTGVDKTDFALAQSGVSGASVTTVTDSGDHKSYNVLVNTGSGDGTLGLNLVDNDSITDLATNKLGGTGTTGGANGSFTGQVFTIDKTPPSVSSINRVNSSPTNVSSVQFTVTFSEAVTGVDAADFALATSGTISGASISNVAVVDSSHYTVTVSTGSGDGTIGLNLVDNDSIADPASNKLGGTGTGNGNFTGQVYTIDRTPPAVSSITRADASPTNAASVNFNVTFSEAVTGVDITDFALTVTGSIASASITSVTPVDGSHYTVTVNTGTGTGTGTLRLDVLDDDSITDQATNPLGGAGANNGAFTSGETYSITPPGLTAHDAAVSEPQTGTALMTFTVSLSSPADASGISVHYQTADDTGGAHPATGGTSCGGGVDYLTASGTLNFAQGEQVKTVTVNVCAEGISESDETLLLQLSNATRSILTRSQATGTITSASAPGTILISELRASGPNGPNDDFVELYNNTGADITVPTGGWGLFKMGSTCDATPVLVGVVPAGVFIPARGHYLLTGSAYSLANYGGTGIALGDAQLTADIESDHNLALFSTTDLLSLSTATRLDAVGFTSNTGGNCDLLREGASLSPVSASTSQYSFVRKLLTGTPRDTNDNASDFALVATDGNATLTAAQLGAPAPENLSSPINRSDVLKARLIDVTKPSSSAPNRDRSLTDYTDTATPSSPSGAAPGPAPLAHYASGTLVIRRRFTNNTSTTVTRLRFHVVDITTLPSPAGTADLRGLTTPTPTVSVQSNDATVCGANPLPCNVTVKGTTIEQVPTQGMGGGLNSTFTVSGVSIAPGGTVDVQFLFGVVQSGSFRFFINVEALPVTLAPLSTSKGALLPSKGMRPMK